MPSTPSSQRRQATSPHTLHPAASHPHQSLPADYTNGNSLAASNGKGHTNGTANGHVAGGIPSLVNGDAHTSSPLSRSVHPPQKHFISIAGPSSLSAPPSESPSTSNGHLFPPHSVPQPAISIKAQGKARALDDVASGSSRKGRRPSDPDIGHQYVPPSRLFASPSPPPTGSSPRSIPIEALKSELNHEDDASIPLAAVVERVASEAYETLQNLGETISSLPSPSRRARIFDTALDLRRQMIKLYVLVKWSKCAKHMQLLKNIIGLIHEQSYQTVDAREHLTETHGILPKARERNHDLVTAIDVLSTGLPQRLDPAIRDEAVPPDPITDSQARAIVHELEEAIRVRMASSEILPLPLRAASYEVSDGRVTLSVPDLFSFSLTLSGSKDDDRWFLLSISFDYKITGLGQDRFPQNLWEQQREGFIATANDVLAPKPAGLSAAERQEQDDVIAAPTDAADAVAGALLQDQAIADAPIVRLYNFLQSQALEYQLDILAFQTSELSRLLWRGSLHWRWQERTLIISYWTHGEGQASSSAPPGPSNGRSTPRGPTARKPRWNPAIGGTLRLQVLTEETESASALLLKALNLQAEDGTGDVQPHLREEDQEKRMQLKLQWELDEQMLGLPEPIRLTSSNALTGIINAQTLDAEAILNDVTKRHAYLALLALKDRVARSVLARDSDTALGAIVQGPDSSSMEIRVSQTLRVILSLDHRSGRLSLDSLADASDASLGPSLATGVATSSLNKMIKEATRTLNVAPDALIEILIKLRIVTIREDIERKAAYVGLQCSRRLQLAQEEYVKLGAQPSQLLFLPLQPFPSFHLTIVVKKEQVMVALICPLPMVFGDGSVSSSLLIRSLQWLDIDRILATPLSSGKRKRIDITATAHRAKAFEASSGRNGKSLPASDLARLHSYACALTLSSQVESQLRLRAIQYVYIPSEAHMPCRHASALAYQRAEDAIPSVTLRSADIFGPTATALLQQNAVLRVNHYWNAETCSARLVTKLRFNPGANGECVGASDDTHDPTGADDTLPTKEARIAICDPRRSLIIFQCKDVAQAIPIFQYEWHAIAKVVSLARWLASKASTKAYPARLRFFDLRRVTLTYGPGYTLSCNVQWNVGTPTSPPGHRLSFGSAVKKGAFSGDGQAKDISMHGSEAIQTSTSEDAAGDEASQSANPVSGDQTLSATNPHESICSYLESLLDASSERSSTQLPDWDAFVCLLNQTLPVLATLADIRNLSCGGNDDADALEDATEALSKAALQPDVEWLSASWYRVIFLERYRLDIRLARDSKLYLYDASVSASTHGSVHRHGSTDTSSLSSGGLDFAITDAPPIPGLKTMLAKVAKQEALPVSASRPSLRRPQNACIALGSALLCDLHALTGSEQRRRNEAIATTLADVRDASADSRVSRILRNVIDYVQETVVAEAFSPAVARSSRDTTEGGKAVVDGTAEAKEHTGSDTTIKEEKEL